MPGTNTAQPVSKTYSVLNNAATVGAARSMANPARYYGGNAGRGYGGGSPGYYPSPYYGPYSGDYSLGGTLQGAASVINAQGEFNIQNQQAKLVQQQAGQAKLDTRRQTFDEMMYEKANTPSFNDIQEKAAQEELRRVRHDPPPAEIWSGAALNTLLKAVQKEEAYLGAAGPAVPLDPTIVPQLNLSGGTAAAGVGVLRSDRLEWPLALQKAYFAEDRKKLDDLCGQLVQQASSGRVDGMTLSKMQTASDSLKGKIKEHIDDLSPGEYIKANRFCNDLMTAGRSLEDPAAVNLFNGKWDARAANVPQLIGQMSSKGLTFAPAASGQETAYTAMYRALVDYDMALNKMTARLQSPGTPTATQ